MQKISCVIHTYNSELFLEKCLKSVKWCDEIVIVDMYSTDRTRLIAEEYGAKVFLHENLGYADPARAFGLEKCTFNWVLALDSDEIVPERLALKLKQIANQNTADVVYLPFRNFFFGKELQGTGWSYRDISVQRFFKKGFLKYGHEVHNFAFVEPTARILKINEYNEAIIHFNYNSVFHFISKLNRYTDKESEKNIYLGNPWLQIIYHFNREMWGRFFIKHGYKDGWVGLYLSLAMAFYRATSVAKKNLPSESSAIQTYLNYSDEGNK